MRVAAALLVVLFASEDVSAQCSGCFRPSFSPVIRGYEANGALEMVSADFDGDGIPDLVVAAGSTIGFMRGSGTGSFDPPVPYASAGSSSIATADFNGDGVPDVATTGVNLSIFLGNGDGTFQPPIEYTPDFQAYTFIAAADFNGDGIPDLVATGFSPQLVRVYLGNGDGTFQPPIEFGGPLPAGLAVADFNGDGFMDVAVSSFPDQVAVFLNNGQAGFSGPQLSPAGFYGALAVGDFNQDGVPDLARAGFSDVVVLLGVGDGTFTTGDSYVVGNGPNYVVAGDFNRDGIMDLAVSVNQDGNVLILPGRGDGTFGPADVFPAGDQLGPLVAQDFDGNGWLDLAVPSPSLIEVLLADNSGAFPRAQLFDTAGASSFALLAELTGDSLLDLAVGNTQSPGVSILPGLSTTGFGPPISVPLSGAPQMIAAALFNGDGQMDLAVATAAGIQIILSNGNGTFQTLPPFGTFSAWAAAGDFNGDGKTDLAWMDGSGDVAISLGNGDGTFTPGPVYPGFSIYGAIAIADFNGDGKRDLAVASFNRLAILLGQGDGSFAIAGDYTGTWIDPRLVAADFDGDGKTDLAMTAFGGPTALYWGRGDGSLDPPMPLPGGIYPSDVATSDVNGDNIPDLLVSGAISIRIFASRGDRSFDQADIVNPLTSSFFAVGDVDGDGRSDVVVAGGFGPQAAVLRNTICTPSRLAIALEPSSCDVLPGTPFPAQPVLHIVDDGDNLMTCETGTVSATIVPGTGTPGASLGGTTAVAAVAGVASFTNLSIDQAGRSYVLEFAHPVGSTLSRALTQGLGAVLVGPAAFCAGMPATYRTSSGGYDRYQWSLDGLPISRADVVSLEGLSAGPHTLGVVVYEDGCVAGDSLPIDVQATPAAPIIIGPTSARLGQTGLVATVAFHPGSSYQWLVLGGAITSGQGTNVITFDAGSAGTTMTVGVTELSSAGCPSPEGFTLVQVDFADVATDSPFRDDIDNVARHGITTGCGSGNYCPDTPVSRAQMAVLLLKAKHGSNFVPPPAHGIFLDVPPGSFAADWIEDLAFEGIAAGCGGGNYCPDAPTTRAEMAVLLLKTEHGASYAPPACSGVFQDVECAPTPAFAVNWIERLFAEGITSGCSNEPALYCPTADVAREQMAVFLVKTFNLQ